MTATQEPNVIDIRDESTRSAVAVAEREPDTQAVDLVAGERRERRAKAASSSTDVSSVISRGLTTFSLLVLAMLVFLFVLSGFAEARTQVGLQRRFAKSVENLAAPTGGVIDNGTPVADLRIPAIGLHQIVVQGTTSGTLRAGPGHLRATPLPGQVGNSVLFARREAYGGPFRHIGSLHKGDEILVWTMQGRARYRVDSVFTTRATRGDPIGTTAGKNQLTLVTSDPPYVGTSRLYAQAHLLDKPWAGSSDPNPLDRDELGLSGENDGILSLVLWLEVLLIAAVGSVWLWRRWTRWSAYLVCVPIVLASAWIVFENITKLLPATL
ncbi:MAG TPA: sortase [Acidimicrobiia bacterium]|nr:sortase [Acidimicrobiia bacterium]